MNKTEMISKAQTFFDALTEELKESYKLLDSCNIDISRYLCPNGTLDEVTYSSKPDRSFRISDHWNWYSNIKKCPDEHYIQCYTKDLPWTKKRLHPGKASKPIYGVSVCLFKNNKYHVVYGEKFNRKTKTWSWVECSVEDAVKLIFE